MSFPISTPFTEEFDFNKALASAFSPEYVLHVNQLRSRVVSLCNNQPGSQSLLDAIEQYLPFLNCFCILLEQQDKDGSVRGFSFTWKAVLSKSVLKNIFTNRYDRPTITCNSLWYEVHCILLTYAYCLMSVANRMCGAWEGSVPFGSLFSSTAFSVSGDSISSIGSSTVSSSCDFEGAAKLLSRAAGVFAYISEHVSPRWPNPPKNCPPECHPVVTKALSLLVRADADRLLACRAIQKGMKSGTIARVMASVVKSYEDAMTMLHRSDGTSSSLTMAQQQELTEALGSYMYHGRSLTEALLWQRLAMDCRNNEKYGDAIGCLQQALEEMKRLDAKIKFEHIKDMDLAKIVRSMNRFKDDCVLTNNHITYQNVSSLRELRASVYPKLHPIAEVIAFTMPDPIYPK